MPALQRAAVKSPVLPKEAVQVDALGGEVIVRGLLASERMWLTEQAIGRIQADDAQPAAADATDELGIPYQRIPRVLAQVVSLDDGKPLYTADEWQVFGGQHPGALLDLYGVAKRLSGMDLSKVKKNSEASP